MTNGDVTSPLTGCCCCQWAADDEDDDGAWADCGGLAARSAPITDILLASARPERSLRCMLTERGTVRGNVGTAPDTPDAPPPPAWYESAPASQPKHDSYLVKKNSITTSSTYFSFCLSSSSSFICSEKRHQLQILNAIQEQDSIV